MMESNYGRFEFVIERYLRENKISKNSLCLRAKIEHTQLQNYCKNKTQRIDFAVMARICHTLGCSLSDLILYHPPTE